jgi:hypothetical protein
MDVNEVGIWRFCPACGRPIMESEFTSEDSNSEFFNFEEVRCSCCERPWIACPCTPVWQGECSSIVHDMQDYENLGAANSWYAYKPPNLPALYLKCCEAKHHIRQVEIGRCYNEHICDTCKIKWTVDSTD